jgi:hypothetical protein
MQFSSKITFLALPLESVLLIFSPSNGFLWKNSTIYMSGAAQHISWTRPFRMDASYHAGNPDLNIAFSLA